MDKIADGFGGKYEGVGFILYSNLWFVCKINPMQATTSFERMTITMGWDALQMKN